MRKNASAPFYDFLKHLDIDQDVQQRLSNNLSRIYSGNSEVYITPIAKEHTPEKIIAEWNTVFQASKSEMNDPLISLEEAQIEKLGPRSLSVPWSERWKSVNEYFEKFRGDTVNIESFPDSPRRNFLRPISFQNAMKLMKNNTSSGLPYFVKQGKIKERVLNEIDELISRKDPCVLFTRTQEQLKTRDVWGYPMADKLNEMRFYKPILEYQRKLHWRSALTGPDCVNRKITHIINGAISDHLSLYSVDFSGYDKSLKLELQQLAGNYYKSLFQPIYHDEIDDIVNRKATIGLVTPDGVMTGPHGVPSGSTFTNEDDSVIQRIVSRSSGCVIDDLFDCQGDDGAYCLNESKISSFNNAFTKLGITVNEDKSHISNNYLIYLQNLYHPDYQRNGIITGVYPTYRALNRILYQERWEDFEDYGIKGSDYYSIRTISILENCKEHPLFEKLVRLVLKYDKYKLSVSRKGIKQYVEMMSDSSGTEGIYINQYGDDLKGIRSFKTFQMIKRLSR